jgi:hypothetical protein
MLKKDINLQNIIRKKFYGVKINILNPIKSIKLIKNYHINLKIASEISLKNQLLIEFLIYF